MSRKRCKRKVWSTRGTPVTYGLRAEDVKRGQLLVRASLDAILSHTGTEEHIDSIVGVAMFCRSMCERLRADGSVSDASALDAAHSVAIDGFDAIAGVKQRLIDTGKVGCTGAERQALVALIDVNEELDKVASRRQALDVVNQVFGTLAAVDAQERIQA